MSGPKVIHVVTRQEVIDTCEAAIAEVDHALAEWQRIMDRNMIVAAGDLARFIKGRDALRRLLQADQFLDVQKAVSGLAAAIQNNVQQQLAAHNSRVAQEQRRERSLQFGAEAVLARCQEMSVEIPVDCIQVLTDAAAGRGVDAQIIQRAMSQATSALYATDQSTAFTKQRDLAEVLGATGDSTNAQEVLKAAEDSLIDPRIRRISSQLAELESVGEDAIAARFRSRLGRAANAETTGDMRQSGLLLDSLEIELGPAVKRAQQIAALRRLIGVEAAAARATHDWDVCSQDLAAAENAVMRGDANAAQQHVERATALRLEKRKQRAAQASRTAILEGLRGLGYDVREGMATQWAEKKQLVVKHAAKAGVALELAGTLDGGRLQARMVAIGGSGRDPHADKRAEEQWCSELDSLRKYISGRGGEIKIVKAVAAGTAPLKRVGDEGDEEERRGQALREQRRS